MKLRRLEIKDAPMMLEWMHDSDVTKNLKADFKNMTIDDALAFINNSKKIIVKFSPNLLTACFPAIATLVINTNKKGCNLHRLHPLKYPKKSFL